MKVRNGFVSNSSSSSFVLAKAFIQNEKLYVFREWFNSQDFFEAYFDEDENYVVCEYDHRHNEDVRNKLNKQNINTNLIFFREE